MISFIAFLLVLVGSFNWFSIGVLQFDFVAGMFGSQANIFSRLVYAIIGFSAIWIIYATIKQKGKIIVKGGKENDRKLLGNFMKKENDNNTANHNTNYNNNTNNNNSNTQDNYTNNSNDNTNFQGDNTSNNNNNSINNSNNFDNNNHADNSNNN